MDYPTTSPPKVEDGEVVEDVKLLFFDALKLILRGDKITRLDWNDKRTYGLLKDGLLQLHKAGENKDTTHPWIINDADLVANDWIVL